MKDFSGFGDFKAWFDNAASADKMTSKSNPLTLNEICYLIRKAGIDCSVSWRTDDGFKVIPSIKEALIPTRYLQMKMKLVDFEPADPNHYDDSTFKGYVQVDVIPEYLELNIAAPIEKALEDWDRELTDIHTLLGCSELLAGMAEEAAELAQAALKLRRTIDGRNPTPVSPEEASHKLNEEFADVVLCAAALGLDREEVERFIREKAARWFMRLEVDE